MPEEVDESEFTTVMVSRCLHAREMQNGVAAGHTLPQPPQFVGLSMLVVQPF